MDSELIGSTTMELLDRMEEEPRLENGRVIAVGIVCVVEDEHGTCTYTRTNCSDEIAYQQRGLFYDALRVVNESNNAEIVDDIDDDEDEI